MTATTPDIIEGAYRVVSITDLPSARRSPNRRRAAVRIVFWNLAAMIAVVVLPLLA